MDIQTSPQDALDQYTAVPPAVVQEAADNPKVVQAIARTMHVVTLDAWFRQVNHAQASAASKVEFMKHVAAVGAVIPKETTTQTGAGFSVQINLGGAGPTQTVTVQATPANTPDDPFANGQTLTLPFAAPPSDYGDLDVIDMPTDD